MLERFVLSVQVGNDEMVGMIGANVFHSADEGLPTFQTAAFIEGEVGLEAHAIGRGGVNDGAVKLKDGIFGICQMGGKFALIGVKPDTKETAFETNLLVSFVLNDYVRIDMKDSCLPPPSFLFLQSSLHFYPY